MEVLIQPVGSFGPVGTQETARVSRGFYFRWIGAYVGLCDTVALVTPKWPAKSCEIHKIQRCTLSMVPDLSVAFTKSLRSRGSILFVSPPHSPKMQANSCFGWLQLKGMNCLVTIQDDLILTGMRNRFILHHHSLGYFSGCRIPSSRLGDCKCSGAERQWSLQ